VKTGGEGFGMGGRRSVVGQADIKTPRIAVMVRCYWWMLR